MSLTIDLPPEIERRLREKAAREGKPAEAVAAAVLVDALDWESQFTDAGDGIRRGLEDFDAGRSRQFTHFAEEQRRKHHLPQQG